MSSQDLIDAYVGGQISRRTLIRRLVAGGISFAAAVSYAHLLAPEAEAACYDEDPYYPCVHLRILSSDLEQVVDKKHLVVRVRSARKARLRLRAWAKENGNEVPIGSRYVQFDHPGKMKVRIPLNDLDPLRHRNRARVIVRALWEATDHVSHVVGVDEKTLT